MVPTSLPGNAPLVLGPPIIGITLNWWLYGIFVMQYLFYLNNVRSRDRKPLQAVVHFLFVLDTAQTLTTMDDAFFWFVHGFGNYPALFRFNLAGFDGPFLDAIITFTVQLVYCWRLSRIGDWKVFPVIIALLSLASCIGGTIEGLHSTIFHIHENGAIYLWLLATAVTDTMIAISMTYLLLKYRKYTSSGTMLSIAKRILVLTLETNAVTATVAIALVITFFVPSLAPPHTNIYLVFGYTLGKMYSNCFMVFLNQRIHYDGSMSENETISYYHTQTPSPTRHGFNPAVGQTSVIRLTEIRTHDQP